MLGLYAGHIVSLHTAGYSYWHALNVPAHEATQDLVLACVWLGLYDFSLFELNAMHHPLLEIVFTKN